MNRVGLVAAMAEATDLTLVQAHLALIAALEAITVSLARGEDVTLHGFGSFSSRARSPRTVVHPLTKARLTVSPSRTVHFAPAAGLRKRVAAEPATERASTV